MQRPISLIKRSFIVVITILATCLVAFLFSTPTRADIPTPSSAGWQLVFQDNFSDPQLNGKVWNTCYLWITVNGACSDHGGFGEMENYALSNVHLNDGVMSLQADRVNNQGIISYPSGMVNTQHRFSYLYGYIEARVKIPQGQGFWPAFWLLSDDSSSSNEVDIFENLAQDPFTMYEINHYDSATKKRFAVYHSPVNLSKDFHTYALDWEPDKLVWYIDGKEVYRELDAAAIPHKAMFFIFNLAVGGDWGGDPNKSTPFPSTMDVDYVEVLQPAAFVTPTPTLVPTATTVPLATPTPLAVIDVPAKIRASGGAGIIAAVVIAVVSMGILIVLVSLSRRRKKFEARVRS